MKSAVTCALASESQARTVGVRSVVLVLRADVEVACPGPRIGPRDGFLDLKRFLMRFISLMMKIDELEGQRERTVDYISGERYTWPRSSIHRKMGWN